MKIRRANQADAISLAQLVFSSAPLALSTTFDINDELSALNFLHSNLLTADGQYGYANHWVAEIDNQVVACLSAWHSDLPDSFHQSTLTKLTDFYGISHALSVLRVSQALQDCMSKPKKHEWCIGHYAVLTDFQKQGVGSALLEVMHKQALAFGKLALCLDVESTNIQAIDFYLRRGFIQKSESGVSPNMLALGIGSHLHLSKQLI